MQYTRLGKSDLLVSRICMGCMGVGRISPGLVKFTADPLFLDLWQRPALTPVIEA